MSSAKQTSVTAKFRKMHESGCFVLPNPWDIGTTIYLENLGFEALATTSAGFAFSRGRRDGGVSRDEMLAHIREIVEATTLPVNADFLAGYADEPEGVADECATLCCNRSWWFIDRRQHRSEGRAALREKTRNRSYSSGALGD